MLKVVPGNGDVIIQVDRNCNEKKEWMELEYEAWYTKQSFKKFRVAETAIAKPAFGVLERCIPLTDDATASKIYAIQ